tara:strand:+ start:116 stop:427 length:312 start_codon:yes stop_codon:yes gene_type:complete
MNKIFNFFILLLLLNSCSGLEDAGKVLRNEKTSSTDEFLVKKREPLIMPPDYNEIPKPGDISEDKKKRDEEKIKQILKSPSKKEIEINNNSSVEELIIDKIRR